MKVYVVIHDDGMSYENDHHVDRIYKNKKSAQQYTKRMNAKGDKDYDVWEHDVI